MFSCRVCFLSRGERNRCPPPDKKAFLTRMGEAEAGQGVGPCRSGGPEVVGAHGLVMKGVLAAVERGGPEVVGAHARVMKGVLVAVERVGPGAGGRPGRLEAGHGLVGACEGEE